MTRRIFLLALVALTLQSCAVKHAQIERKVIVVVKNNAELVVQGNSDLGVLHVVTPVTAELLADLKAINGVDTVFNNLRYSVMVGRARLYTWEDLRPAILAAAKRHTMSHE